MADEFGITLRLTVTKGYFSDSINASFNDDMNIIGLSEGVQLIGTAPESISFGDVAYEGWLYLENVDPTAANIIDYGPYSGGTWLSSFRLNPGEGALVKLKPGAVLYAAARVSEARLLVKCYDSSTGS